MLGVLKTIDNGNKGHGQPALRLTDPCKYIGETAGRTTAIRRNVARYALLFGRLVKSVVGSGNPGFSSQSKIADAVDRARHARIWGESGRDVWSGWACMNLHPLDYA